MSFAVAAQRSSMPEIVVQGIKARGVNAHLFFSCCFCYVLSNFLSLLSLAAELFKTLQLSVVSNRLGVVRMLLATPAYGLSSRLNERAHGGKGDAVLHGAVVHGLVEMASLLIDRGADVAMRSYDGLTALQLAQQYERRDMAAMIEKRLKEVRPTPRGARPPEQQKPQQQNPQQQETKPAASKSKYQQAKDNKRQKKQQQQRAASAAATAQATGRRSSQHDEL